MKPKNKVSLSLPFVFLLLLLVIHGCSSSSNPAPVVPTDQDASGLYITNGNVEANFINPTTKEILTDVKGMIKDGRFIFFDTGTNVLYDGQISVSKSTVSGTAKVYHDGKIVDSSVTVTGTVTSVSSISLTLTPSTGSNFVGGTPLTGVFIKPTSIYDRAADNPRILSDGSQVKNNEFTGDIMMAIPAMLTSNFKVFTGNNYTFVSIKTGVRCDHAHVNPIMLGSKNIYTLTDETITLKTGCTLPTTGYTGFASVVDGNLTDDVLWYAVTNPTDSIFAVLPRLP